MSDTIIVKIKKLLSLAQNNSNEHEAELAMGRVQELLAEHNLEMAQIEASRAGGNSNPAQDEKRTKEDYKRGAMYRYQQELWSTVATVNFCWHWTTPVYKGSRMVTRHHYFVGKESNIIAVKLLGDYLEETINRLCPWQGRQCLSRSAISWKEGCAARLRTRLYLQKDERERKSDEDKAQKTWDNGAGTAVALRDVTLSEYERNHDFLYGEGSFRAAQERIELARNATVEVIQTETEEEKSKREKQEAKWRKQDKAKRDKYWANKDVAAYMSGQQAANKINLDAQVAEAPARKAVGGK